MRADQAGGLEHNHDLDHELDVCRGECSLPVASPKTSAILARAKKARGNLDEFLRFVLGIVPAKHQLKLVRELQEIGDSPVGKKLCVIAPPGSGKTTILIGFTAWMIGRYPDQHLGYFSYADQVGWERSRAIRDMIEHSRPYRLVFPEVLPNKSNWGVESFTVRRDRPGDPHPTLRAGGTTSAVVAYRLNGLVIDDPHDQKNSNSATLREKVFDNYEKAIRTRMTRDSWQVVIGTRWADSDFIGRVTKNAGWKTIHIKALGKSDGKDYSYWEDQYDLEFLKKIKQEAPALFAMQYQGDTSGGETGIIRRVDTYGDGPRWELQPEAVAGRLGLVVASGWDTAFKRGEENDYTVGYTGGLGRDGRIFILERFKERVGSPELMDEINRLNSKWRYYSVWIEDAASGTPAIQNMMVSMPHIPTVPVKPSQGGKVSRAHYLAPFIHGGHVLFPKYADWFPDCLYHLIHFGSTDHDDDVDALYILVSNLLHIRHPMTTIERPNVRLVMA